MLFHAIYDYAKKRELLLRCSVPWAEDLRKNHSKKERKSLSRENKRKFKKGLITPKPLCYEYTLLFTLKLFPSGAQ
jgi:hypothetical protein